MSRISPHRRGLTDDVEDASASAAGNDTPTTAAPVAAAAAPRKPLRENSVALARRPIFVGGSAFSAVARRRCTRLRQGVLGAAVEMRYRGRMAFLQCRSTAAIGLHRTPTRLNRTPWSGPLLCTVSDRSRRWSELWLSIANSLRSRVIPPTVEAVSNIR